MPKTKKNKANDLNDSELAQEMEYVKKRFSDH